jgi:hypothetical protein
MAGWEHVRRERMHCCRNELDAGAECVMNCCVYNSRDEEWYDDTRSNGKTKCRYICGEHCDQVWCRDCIEKIIEIACRSTLSFPPLPAFKTQTQLGRSTVTCNVSTHGGCTTGSRTPRSHVTTSNVASRSCREHSLRGSGN